MTTPQKRKKALLTAATVGFTMLLTVLVMHGNAATSASAMHPAEELIVRTAEPVLAPMEGFGLLFAAMGQVGVQ